MIASLLRWILIIKNPPNNKKLSHISCREIWEEYGERPEILKEQQNQSFWFKNKSQLFWMFLNQIWIYAA